MIKQYQEQLLDFKEKFSKEKKVRKFSL
jgi:hypothetical protein